jgi:hypothetical protein
MTGGLEIRVLEDANTRSVAGSGFESCAGVRFTEFVDGDCPWDLSLGHPLVMRKFDGGRFG